ncbi:MAG: hypothetical protein AAF458_15025 [Pseudomonadota bacterium]
MLSQVHFIEQAVNAAVTWAAERDGGMQLTACVPAFEAWATMQLTRNQVMRGERNLTLTQCAPGGLFGSSRMAG